MKIKIEKNDFVFVQRSPKNLIKKIDTIAFQQKCSRNRAVNAILEIYTSRDEAIRGK